MIGTWGRLAPTLLLQSLQAEMWSLPRRNHHRQYMTAQNGDHATICGSDWRSSRNVAQPALPKPQARAFVRRSKPSHRLTGTASSDPSSQTYPPLRCPLAMVDTIAHSITRQSTNTGRLPLAYMNCSRRSAVASLESSLFLAQFTSRVRSCYVFCEISGMD